MKEREKIIEMEAVVRQPESFFRPVLSFPQLERMLAADSSQLSSSPGWRAMVCSRVVPMGS